MHREFGPLEWSAGSHESISSLPTVTVAPAARHEAGLPFCSSARLVSGLGSSRICRGDEEMVIIHSLCLVPGPVGDVRGCHT